MLSCGIVGLPNVGKSTLFNALLKKQQALAANYPFATIEPNVGVVPVPDSRLQKLAEITKEEENPPLHKASEGQGMSSSPPIKSATVEFVDIAGLVKGASEGAGLGNKFLSHIREVQIIAHVVRAFEDENVIKEGSVDAASDYATIETELILADLQTLIKQKDSKAVKTDPLKKSAINKLYEALDSGKPARDVSLTDEEKESIKDLFLLSNKPELIVLNVSEEDYTPEKIRDIQHQYTSALILSEKDIVVICAKIESELSELSGEEQKQYLADLGLQESGLERLIQKAYEKLGLISFLTAGEKEVRAWTIKKGTTAQNAAGVIHNDFIKHFIKAEVIGFEDFVSLGGWKSAREKGKARFEGRDYVVNDGDVIEFKVNI
ncbi:MAG TPA: redox-regulated ATPase YchF [Candidatus Saccharimonadales bacterium]|nr:redox-regulated ATPase YchF [Candidatus Saccharimonadales bacterium]